jgi:tRNA pseudouridine55 synthase
VGHGGTLDPDATGVLPILLGEATKLQPYLVDLDKEYLARVALGVTTDTQDASGVVLERRPVPALDRAAVEAALARFVGTIQQVPPMHSAVKRDGRRLYELARAGVTVERAARPVVVHAIALERLDPPELTIRVRCGKGTYIRTLAADLGDALGCGASLAGLVRTRVGPYALERAVPWAELREARDPRPLWARVLPPDSALEALPAVALDAAAARAFGHGRAVPVPAPDGVVRAYGPSGELLGVGRARGGAVQPERLLHADPARPSGLPA